MLRLLFALLCAATLVAATAASLNLRPLQLWSCAAGGNGSAFHQWLYTSDKHLRLIATGDNGTEYCAVAPVAAAGTAAVLTPCSAIATQWVISGTPAASQLQLKEHINLCLSWRPSRVFGANLALAKCDATTVWALRGNGTQPFRFEFVAGGGGAAADLCADGGSTFGPPCANPANTGAAFCNTSLSLDARAADFVARVPAAAWAGMFDNNALPVDGDVRLPRYQWWNEGLHGVANSPGVHYAPVDTTTSVNATTSFPQVCTTSATFDARVFSAIGDIVGQEGRAMNNIGQAGLTYWAPNINIYRDPRWGRGQETPGEDPLLTGTYAAHFVRSMQNNSLDPSRLRVASCCKHFAGYDLEDWGGYSRHSFDAVISPSDEADTYFPAFQACIHQQGGASAGIMCSYNAVNGVPSCANKPFFTGLARGKWGFDGYVTSDCGAVAGVGDGIPAVRWPGHHYTRNASATVAAVLGAGMDLDCTIQSTAFVTIHLAAALADGAVDTSAVTTALSRQARMYLRFGAFDPASAQPYKKYTAADIDSPRARRIALDAARDGIVLVKHTANASFPLSKLGASLRTLAVLGPNANATTTLQGNYYGQAPYLVSPLAGLTEALQRHTNAAGHVSYAEGVPVSKPNATGLDDACKLVAAADAAVLVIGNDQSIESEGHDRTSITLPGLQPLFVARMARCKRAGAPLVVVVLSGGSVDYAPLLADAAVTAVLWAGYPGQSGGQAIADVVFGAVAPSGRLPHTAYVEAYAETVGMADMRMAAKDTGGGTNPSDAYPGRTHRYLTDATRWAAAPFGHGLSLTAWRATVAAATTHVAAAPINAAVAASELLFNRVVGNVTVTLVNAGDVAAKLSVLVFARVRGASRAGGLQQTLLGFAKTPDVVSAGHAATVVVPWSAQSLVQFSATAQQQVAVPGVYDWWSDDQTNVRGSFTVA